MRVFKIALVTVLALTTVSSFANYGVKRVTTGSCFNEESSASVFVKYDSSVSLLGPVLLKINNEEIPASYLIQFEQDGTIYRGKMKNGDNFSLRLKGAEEYETELIIENDKISLGCQTKTKFRIY